VKILITGANGQLGSEFRQLANEWPDSEFVFTDIEELDVTRIGLLHGFVANKQFDFLINCSAYTAVDKAEDESEIAYMLNVQACENLALVCKKNNIVLVHFSTDFIFDGKKTGAYIETDPPAPLSAYGKTKLLGEDMLRKNCNNSLIIRTSWLFSAFGNNFVKTIIKKASENNQLQVVFDQIGTPTYAADLAYAVLNIIHQYKISGNKLYHFSNEGAISWYDFAMAILELSDTKCDISPVLSVDYPVKAVRPANSLFDKSKIINDFQLTIPYWRHSLEKCINLLKK